MFESILCQVTEYDRCDRHALGHVVVDAKGSAHRHPLTVLELLRRQHVTARRSAALDAEQVVIPDRERALTPAGFVDCLGDRHRRRDAIRPALRRDGARRELANEGLLTGSVRDVRRRGRWVVAGVRGSSTRRRAKGRAKGRAEGRSIRRLQPRDSRRSRALSFAGPRSRSGPGDCAGPPGIARAPPRAAPRHRTSPR